jgi:pimeloyl-ACP methyl ester carboxylesterase
MTGSEKIIAYEETGAGFPVVLIHGFPLDHSIWNPVVKIMKSVARIVLPDLRGLSRSIPGDRPLTMGSMAVDIAMLMDQLLLEKAIIVGHSMGGYVSLAFSSNYPSRLAGLGLVATQAGSDTPERKENRYITAEKVERDGMAWFAEIYSNQLTAGPAHISVLKDIILNASPKGVSGCLRAMAERVDYRDILPAIHVPAVVITGLEDVLISPEQSRIMAASLPDAELVEIPGAGHMPMLESPSLVASALNRLIHKVTNKD